MSNRIIFLRHGLTEGNLKGWYYGATDLPLTEQGKDALGRMASAGLYPDLPEHAQCFTTGLVRTDQTLEIAFGRTADDTIPALQEMKFGDYECRNYREMMDDPIFLSWGYDTTGEVAFPGGGESRLGFAKRIEEGLAQLLERHHQMARAAEEQGQDAVTVMVCHGGTITAAMDYLFPQTYGNQWDWMPDPGFGYIVTWTEEKPSGYEPIQKQEENPMEIKRVEDKNWPEYQVYLVAGPDPAGEEAGVPDVSALRLAGFEEGGTLDLPDRRTCYISVKDGSTFQLRIGAARAAKALWSHQITTLKISVAGSGTEGLSKVELASALTEGWLLGSYRFDQYKSEQKACTLETVFLDVAAEEEQVQKAIDKAIGEAVALTGAVNRTRDIVNQIPQTYTPRRMAEDAATVAGSYGTVSCQVYGKEDLEKEQMGAFLAVNQSSPHAPRMIHLTYTPAGESKGTIAFVGKGLTYDSGGLSLKSNPYTMKSDKAGAAAVLGIVQAAAELKLPLTVHGVLGCTENMIGSDAYKPDDVVVSRSSVTIEINNTDAEGRLVLADCLSWTQDHIKPDQIIDLATLTGACVTALGEYTTGVLGNSWDLQMAYKKAAEQSGERYSALEFNDMLRDLLKSKVADVRNSTPGKPGGAITAGLFLDKFIQEGYKDKWLHLDIAGPAFVDHDWECEPAGGSGAGVRGCVYYLRSLA